MNEFLELFGGPIAVISSIITTWIISRCWRTIRHSSMSKYLIPILYWGPIFLMCCMFLHCFRNGYNTIVALMANIKAFNFYYYSLQMFGGVLAYQSYLLLQKCKSYVSGKHEYKSSLYRSILIIVATSLPTFIFTPIGIVPTVVLAITSISLLFIQKKKESKEIKVEYVVPVENPQLN
jgi:hypothetical protein